MDPGNQILFILFLLFFLFLSALLSGTETAFFSIDKTVKNFLENDEQPSSKRVLKLLENPQRLLITILIGNNIVNIFIATYATILTQDISEQQGWSFTLSILINIIVVSLFILTVGEILPKVFAIRDSLKFAKKTSLFIKFVFILLSPISFFFTRYTNKITKLFESKASSIGFSEEELRTLIEISEESGSIENEEKEMISSIMDFSDTTVKEVMVPRIDVSMLSVEASFDEIISLAKETHYSRIPVYEEKIDNIIGIFYVKDLIRYIGGNQQKLHLKPLLHEGYFVPEQKKIQDLLKEFQTKKMHMAIVVDEYGGTSGLVTLEDILEEIVGEIQDEYDAESPLFVKESNTVYSIDGKMPIEELNELLSINLPNEDDIETISGFIYHLTGSLPKEKDVIFYERLSFQIEHIENRRITKIKLTILPQKKDTSEE